MEFAPGHAFLYKALEEFAAKKREEKK